MLNSLDITSLILHGDFFPGAFVPLTMEGNILVDGVLASCYASFDHDIQHIVMKLLLWFPSIMDLLLGEEKSVHSYMTILGHVSEMMSLKQWVHE